MSSRESCTVVHNTLRNNHSLEPHYFIPLHQQSNLQQTKIYKYTAESHWKVIREASLLTWGSSDTRQLKNRLVMKASPRRANLSHAEPVLHSSPPCFYFFSAWWQLNFFYVNPTHTAQQSQRSNQRRGGSLSLAVLQFWAAVRAQEPISTCNIQHCRIWKLQSCCQHNKSWN